MPFNFDVNAWIYIDGGHVLGGFGAYIVKSMAVQFGYICMQNVMLLYFFKRKEKKIFKKKKKNRRKKNKKKMKKKSAESVGIKQCNL